MTVFSRKSREKLEGIGGAIVQFANAEWRVNANKKGPRIRGPF
jgi:hypothetical protein